MLIIIASLCAVFIIAIAGLMVYYTSVVSDKDTQIGDLNNEVARLNTEVNTLNTTVTSLNDTLIQKNELITQKNEEIISLNNQITTLNSQIANIEGLRIDTSDLNVEDVRVGSYYALHVYGRVSNNGGGTAYNAVLHVTALNAEGVAIDTYHSFGGITAGMSLGLDFSIEYTGSPIQSWQIRPIWTNTMVIPVSGTFPP